MGEGPAATSTIQDHTILPNYPGGAAEIPRHTFSKAERKGILDDCVLLLLDVRVRHGASEICIRNRLAWIWISDANQLRRKILVCRIVTYGRVF